MLALLRPQRPVPLGDKAAHAHGPAGLVAVHGSASAGHDGQPGDCEPTRRLKMEAQSRGIRRTHRVRRERRQTPPDSRTTAPGRKPPSAATAPEDPFRRHPPLVNDRLRLVAVGGFGCPMTAVADTRHPGRGHSEGSIGVIVTSVCDRKLTCQPSFLPCAILRISSRGLNPRSNRSNSPSQRFSPGKWQIDLHAMTSVRSGRWC